MSTDQPGPGSPDDPFAKRPRDGDGDSGTPDDRPPGEPPPGHPYGSPPPPSGSPYGSPPPGWGDPHGGGGPGPYGGQDPYGQNPYGGGPQGPVPGPDPLAGMPPLAGGGRRVAARIVDIIIVLVPAYLLEWAVIGAQGSDVNYGRSATGGVFAAGLGFLYEWLMTRASGQTVGKRLMGLRTAMLADGGVPTSRAAAIRALILWIPVFFCYCVWFLIIGITVVFDRPYKQGLHDKAARTVVVEVA